MKAFAIETINRVLSISFVHEGDEGIWFSSATSDVTLMNLSILGEHIFKIALSGFARYPSNEQRHDVLR
jgi:hypothetical protein